MKKQTTLCILLLALLIWQTSAAEEELPEHGSHHPVKEPHEINGEHNPEYDHEAVIGSRSQHQDFESLPPEEAKRRLGILVDQMDINIDGNIDEKELTDWVFTSFRKLDAEEARDYFLDQDKDQDNQVTFKEYLQSYYGYEPEETEDWGADESTEMKEYAKLVSEDEAKFKKADKDGNGALDEEEYAAFYHPWDHEYMHDFEIDRTLAENDENGDGFIDVKEYLGGDIEDRESELIELENFKAFDKNSDQMLDRSEIKEWVIPDHMETAIEEAIHLIQETDEDRDGILSKEEILNKHDLWVGSAATDYGVQIEKLHDPGEL